MSQFFTNYDEEAIELNDNDDIQIEKKQTGMHFQIKKVDYNLDDIIESEKSA